MPIQRMFKGRPRGRAHDVLGMTAASVENRAKNAHFWKIAGKPAHRGAARRMHLRAAQVVSEHVGVFQTHFDTSESEYVVKTCV